MLARSALTPDRSCARKIKSFLLQDFPVAPDPEVIWCPLDPKPLPLNYRHEEETGLYYGGDYNLRGRTPKADVDVCFNGNIAVSQVRLL
jgi:5'-nucleotidase